MARSRSKLPLDGRYLGGEKSPPYEWPIHACIMRARPEVMSVCHTHSKWSSLFGTVERGEALAKVLKESAAVLLRGHGDAVVGASLEEAILRTIRLAFVGELAHMAVAHGEPLYLTEEELATFSADQAFPARPWEYHLSRARDRRSP